MLNIPLNIPLVVTPFLAVLVAIAGSVAFVWLREREPRWLGTATAVLSAMVFAWGVLVVSMGAYREYMDSPPQIPVPHGLKGAQ